MAVALHDVQKLQSFDINKTSGIGPRWKRLDGLERLSYT